MKYLCIFLILISSFCNQSILSSNTVNLKNIREACIKCEKRKQKKAELKKKRALSEARQEKFAIRLGLSVFETWLGYYISQYACEYFLDLRTTPDARSPESIHKRKIEGYKATGINMLSITTITMMDIAWSKEWTPLARIIPFVIALGYSYVNNLNFSCLE